MAVNFNNHASRTITDFREAGYRCSEDHTISESVRPLFERYSSRDVDTSEMKDALVDRKVECELLEYKNEKVAGFVCHSRLTSSVRNLPDALYVKVLGLGDKLYRSDVSALCCRMIEVAENKSARTIAFYCQQRGERIDLIKELKENGFRVPERENSDRALVYLLMSKDASKPTERFGALQREKAEYAAKRAQEEQQRAYAGESAKRKRESYTQEGYNQGRYNQGGYNNGYQYDDQSAQRPQKRMRVSRPRKGETIDNPIEVTLRKQYIHAIQEGKKTKEGRINSGMFTRVRENDYLRFFYKQNRSDDVVCQAVEIKTYTGFREMLEDGGVQSYLPEMPYGREGLEKGVRLYHSIPNYRIRAARSGVMGISLRVFGKSSQVLQRQ